MLAAPTTHFVALAQAILYRGAGLDIVWPPFLAIIAIGAAFFLAALLRFRSTIGQMAYPILHADHFRLSWPQQKRTPVSVDTSDNQKRAVSFESAQIGPVKS